MIYRNAHLPTLPPAPVAPQQATRLRERTNDPAREYARRPGTVQPLPDCVAAVILCKTGFAEVDRHQITITLEGERLYFSSSDSVTIATKNGTGQKVLWAINRRAPDVLHILDESGAYVESIPLKDRAKWFDESEASREALAEARRHIGRDMARLAELHQPETREAVEREQHNAREVQQYLVNTFPAAGSDRAHASDKQEQDKIIAPRRESLLTAFAGRTQTKGATADPERDECPAALVLQDARSSNFSRAQGVAAAIENVEHQRERHAGKQRSLARRVAAVTDDDIDALTSAPRVRNPAPATAAPAEDIDSIL